jgi:hypothetical protein
MLILCYGITKSGSTLAFELIKGMLESVGHRQVRLPDGLVRPEQKVNFVEPLDRDALDQLLAAIGDRWIAVKTHSPITNETFGYLERLLREDRIRVCATYRDPRELCLSLLDAGVHARKVGIKEFSEFTDMEIATRIVGRKLDAFRRWGALRGALRLEYNTVAFSPDAASDSIERWLSIQGDREQAKEHAFVKAFTQRNKAKRNRAVEELSPGQYAALTGQFSEFLERGSEQSWYNERRQLIRTQNLERRRRLRNSGEKLNQEAK